MPKNEDGEFELILANRQLLSVFFIIVILLGVFFTMGYIVGRNSAPVVADTAAQKSGDPPLVVDAPSRPPEPAPRDNVAPADAPPPPSPVVEQPKPEPDPEPARPPSKAAARAAKGDAKGRPASGQAYLQLAATSQHEADIMVDVLHKKGFKAMTAEIEGRPGTYRVLVGPVAENTTNKVRADLQGAGFPGNAAIRRTF